jgi:hypothetical protein
MLLLSGAVAGLEMCLQGMVPAPPPPLAVKWCGGGSLRAWDSEVHNLAGSVPNTTKQCPQKHHAADDDDSTPSQPIYFSSPGQAAAPCVTDSSFLPREDRTIARDILIS